jgi:hypothetical protein
MHPTTLPQALQSLLGGMSCLLHARSAFRLAVLVCGLLFAQGRRRTVTTWLRAAAVQQDFPSYYYFLGSLGRQASYPALPLLQFLLMHLPQEGGQGQQEGDGTAPIRFALDDTPTKRYGPKVQGAGVHHNPSPGPADAPFLYGHVWVSLALVVTHPSWGPIALPLRALLYVRKKDLPKIPARHGSWPFRTKLELAAELVRWAAQVARFTGRPVEVVTDGAYAKKPLLLACAQADVTLISRLRKDAGLRHLPLPRRPGQRGRTPVYGSHAIRLNLRAAQKSGWQTVRVRQYGEERDKRIKSFEATWRPAGGRIRVVLVQEEESTTGWLAYFSTDPAASAEHILAAAAERMTIEQCFHDLKEVEGLGQAQVRDIWTNLGVVQATLWEHTLVELWAWDQPAEELTGERGDSPWDDPTRRPSHADRRKALQRWCLRQEFQGLCHGQPLKPEMHQFIERLLRRAS